MRSGSKMSKAKAPAMKSSGGARLPKGGSGKAKVVGKKSISGQKQKIVLPINDEQDQTNLRNPVESLEPQYSPGPSGSDGAGGDDMANMQGFADLHQQAQENFGKGNV